MRRRRAQAQFRCRTCDAVAVVVRRQGDGVALTGFLGATWLRVDRMKDAERAIRAADAAALHGVHPELQPAWCPQCGASYCHAHWQRIVAGADDHAGWYEATYGTCPEGHRRTLDD